MSPPQDGRQRVLATHDAYIRRELWAIRGELLQRVPEMKNPSWLPYPGRPPQIAVNFWERIARRGASLVRHPSDKRIRTGEGLHIDRSRADGSCADPARGAGWPSDCGNVGGRRACM